LAPMQIGGQARSSRPARRFRLDRRAFAGSVSLSERSVGNAAQPNRANLDLARIRGRLAMLDAPAMVGSG